MIHNDIQNQLQLLIKTSAPPLIEVADQPLQTPEWTPGQRIPAHVLASLPNGRFQVQVGDQVLDLNLPRNTQAGDTLELTYVGASPRPTFALTPDLAKALPANSSVSLSDAAKFLGGLLQKGSPDAAQTAQVARSAPVVTAPPASVQEFAHALRQTVSQSGLFYESHQVQWLSGERSLASLLQEPQGQLSPLLTRPEAAALLRAVPGAAPVVTPDTALPRDAQAVQANPAAAAVAESSPGPIKDAPTPLLSAPSGPQPSEGKAVPLSFTETGRTAAEPVHPQAAPLVQQQLDTLDNRQIVWQGQVWAGQEMTWQIEEQAAREGGGGQEEAPSWHTHLNLQLPSLGGVAAKLAFVEGAIRLDITTDSAASADLMRSQQHALAERLDASGLRLNGMNIRHE